MNENKTSIFLTILFLLIAVSASFGQIGRYDFFQKRIVFYLHEWFIFVFCFFGFWTICYKIKLRKSINSVFLSWIIFLSWLFVSLFFNIHRYSLFENVIGFLYFSRLLLYTCFIGISLIITNEGYLKKQFMYTCVNMFLFIAILTSGIQYILYPNLRNLSYLGWDPHHYRVFGLFFDTTVTALILGTASLYFFYHLLIEKKSLIKLLMIIAFVISSILFLLTYSRIGYLSVGIAFVILSLRLKKYLIFVVLFVAGGLIVLLLPRPSGESVRLERVFTIESRFSDIKEGISLWKKNALVGVGYNRISFNRVNKSPSHSLSAFSSSYVTVLASSGIIGIMIFLFFLIKVLLYFWKSELMFAFFVCLGVSGLFDNTLFQTHILFLVSMLVIKDFNQIFHIES